MSRLPSRNPRPVRREEFSGFFGIGNVLQQVENAHRDADYSEALGGILTLLEAAHGRFFSGQHDPEGRYWPALARSTVRKKGHSTILIDTHKLRESLTERAEGSIRAVSHRGLVFGTSIPYAFYHQHGTARLPVRAHVGIDVDTLDEITGIIADEAVDALRG